MSQFDRRKFLITGTAVLGASAVGGGDRDGRYAFISNIYANTVSVIDVKSLKVLNNVPVGRSPNGISVTP